MGSKIDQSKVFAAVYGAAHFGKSLLWNASELLFAFFLTEACGLPPRQMGLIIALSLVINALADLGVGRLLAGRVRSTLAAARVQMVGAVVSGAAFMTFALSGLVASDHRFTYALGSILLFRIAYPFFDNPQNTILAFAAADDQQRARLSSIRFIFGGLARIALAASFPLLLLGQYPEVQALRFGGLAATLVSVATVTAAALYWLARHTPAPMGPRQDLRTDARLAADSNWGRLLLMVFVTSASISVFGKLEPYFASYALRSVLHGGAMMICVAAGSVVFQPLWSVLARRLGLMTVLRMATLVLAAGALGVFLLARENILACALVAALYGAGAGGLGMSQWALLASMSAREAGRWIGTAAFGLFTCFSKLGLAASILGLGWALDAAPYRDLGVASGLMLMVMVGAPIVGAAMVAALSLGRGKTYRLSIGNSPA